jgi:glucose-1-phosphate cytidylyltransferase
VHGVQDFVICCGYKGYLIKEFFANYVRHMSNVTFDLRTNQIEVHDPKIEPWRVTLVDTGDNTMTGGRLKRVKPYCDGDELVCFTYGDGLSDIDLTAEIAFHRRHGKLCTVASVQPPGRYGALQLADDRVTGFTEKPRGDGGRINGGFFVLSRKCFDLVDGDGTSWEAEPMHALAASNELRAFEHDGFWQPMDTLRDKNHLEELYLSGKAPWMTWQR